MRVFFRQCLVSVYVVICWLPTIKTVAHARVYRYMCYISIHIHTYACVYLQTNMYRAVAVAHIVELSGHETKSLKKCATSCHRC